MLFGIHPVIIRSSIAHKMLAITTPAIPAKDFHCFSTVLLVLIFVYSVFRLFRSGKGLVPSVQIAKIGKSIEQLTVCRCLSCRDRKALSASVRIGKGRL